MDGKCFIALIFMCSLGYVAAFAEQGIFEYELNETENFFGAYKSLFNNSKLYVTIQCDSADPIQISTNWALRQTPCWEEYASLDLVSVEEKKNRWREYFLNPMYVIPTLGYKIPPHFSPSTYFEHQCDSSIRLPEYYFEDGQLKEMQIPNTTVTIKKKHPIFTVTEDGLYLLIVHIKSEGNGPFKAKIRIEMVSDHGYLSAVDRPLLTFYGVSCMVYVLYGILWLFLSSYQWRDLLRIQFWIGGVIFIGMLEMAVFYAEYQSINSTGMSVKGAVLAAEIISCIKRTLARLLVVIVSIGFGIVRPRLGETLHRVVVVGGIYFSLAVTESILRVMHPVNGPSNRAFMAGVPLSVIDAGISWWVFQNLLATMRTLRLRRNLVKLALFRNFTNVLTMAVVSSVVFMIWSIRFLKTSRCLRDWKDIWLDEAFWHVLFSVILFSIMILWRPTQNNQRYAFSPLIDNPEDEEDEEDLFVNEAFNEVKLRTKPSNNGHSKYRNQNLEDELKWVDENIPHDLGEGDLPPFDSEEELEASKFELSKMQ